MLDHEGDDDGPRGDDENGEREQARGRAAPFAAAEHRRDQEEHGQGAADEDDDGLGLLVEGFADDDAVLEPAAVEQALGGHAQGGAFPRAGVVEDYFRLGHGRGYLKWGRGCGEGNTRGQTR